MYKSCIFLILNFLFTGINISAQGLNNDHPIDQTDLKNVLALQDIDIYKFPIDFDVQDNFHINYIIKEYNDGLLVKTINLKEAFKNAIKLYGNDILPFFSKEGEHIIRMYFLKKNQGILLRIAISGNAQEFEFDDFILGQYGSRAFDNNLQDISEPKRLLAYYGNYPSNKSKDAMHCAMEDEDETLAKRFDRVIVVYVEKK